MMEHTKAYLLNKAKATISLLYGILMWLTKLPSDMKWPKTWPSFLQAMVPSYQGSPPSPAPAASPLPPSSPPVESPRPSPFPSPSMSASPPFSSSSKPFPFARASSSSSIIMGDLLGAESGDYMTENGDIFKDRSSEKVKPYLQTTRKGKGKRGKVERTKREFPSPITSLEIRGSWKDHKPSFFTREYMDGKLILKQKEPENCGYFEATRESGRLTLDLILDL